MVGLLLLAILLFGGVSLVHGGIYGWTIFMLSPVLLGGIASLVYRPATGAQAAKSERSALRSLGFVPDSRTGGIDLHRNDVTACRAAGALGSWLVYRAEPNRSATRGGIAILLLLPPASLTWDVTARPPVFKVRSSITIAASPERVWKYVVAFPELPEPREWFFRAGLAYPKLARIEGTGVGAMRYCEFSTGPSWNRSRSGMRHVCCDSALQRTRRRCASGAHTPRSSPNICMGIWFPGKASFASRNCPATEPCSKEPAGINTGCGPRNTGGGGRTRSSIASTCAC